MSILPTSVRHPSIGEKVSATVLLNNRYLGETIMTHRLLCTVFLALFTLCLPAATRGADSPPKLPAPPTNAALEKMKKLAGTWLLVDQDGKPTEVVASIIKVTAGGSAVHET